jgi:hypothetical protein
MKKFLLRSAGKKREPLQTRAATLAQAASRRMSDDKIAALQENPS